MQEIRKQPEQIFRCANSPVKIQYRCCLLPDSQEDVPTVAEEHQTRFLRPNYETAVVGF